MGEAVRVREDSEYEALRGPPEPTIENLLRWERIKLRDAAREAIRLLEGGTLPTREYLDYMFGTDVAMRHVRAKLAKHRDRIAELEMIRSEASMVITPPAKPAVSADEAIEVA